MADVLINHPYFGSLENKEGGDAGQQDARLSREHDKSTSNRKLKAERKRK